jgi:hypothetical protein
MLITQHSFFDLGKLDIPTADWEEYYDESQLKEGSEYLIGVLKSSNDTQYSKSSIVIGQDAQLSYINELYRQFGSRATIIIQEVPAYVSTGTLIIKPGDVEVVGDLTEDEKLELSRWSAILSMNYLFEKEIIVIWGKDNGDRIMVRSIH